MRDEIVEVETSESGTAAWNDAPINLTATADGTTVTLTWEHAVEAEVEAYGVYEIVGGKWTFDTEKRSSIGDSYGIRNS